jgi:tetratricopeptide (TPR) repeat protein
MPRDPNYADTYWSLGLAYEQKRMHAEAIAAFQRAVRIIQEFRICQRGNRRCWQALAHVYAQAGKQSEARSILNQLKQAFDFRHYVSPYAVSLIYIALNDKDSAFQSLGQAFQERDESFVHLRVDPRLDPIRSDGRFQQFLKQINLAP